MPNPTIKPTGNYVHLKINPPERGTLVLTDRTIDPDSTFTVLAVGPTVPLPIVPGALVELRNAPNLFDVRQREDLTVIVDVGSILYVIEP